MKKTTLCFSIFLLAAGLFASPARADLPEGMCNTTLHGVEKPHCGAAVTSTINYTKAYASPGMAAVPVDMWNLCRYIDNTSTAAITASFKSAEDWRSFTSASPFALTHCSRPTSKLTIPPGANCHSPNPATQTASEPDYFRWNLTAPPIFKTSATFRCSDNATGSWTQNAEAVFTGLDSDRADPSWALTEVTYTGGANEKGAANPPCKIKCDVNVTCAPQTMACSN